MPTTRVEAFSDAVIAIIITLMVIEMEIPHGEHLSNLHGQWPSFLTYILSFLYLGIYWSNHHHLLHAADRVNGSILWANLHLLFWLSLIPFTTGWMSENHFSETPTATYGIVLLCAATAYSVLQETILRQMGHDSPFAKAIGRDLKRKVSFIFYFAAIVLAHVEPWVALGLYAAVAVMWLVPDRRIAALFN